MIGDDIRDAISRGELSPDDILGPTGANLAVTSIAGKRLDISPDQASQARGFIEGAAQGVAGLSGTRYNYDVNCWGN